MPKNWPLNDAKHYRAAFLRTTYKEGERRSRRELCDQIGIANGSLKSYLTLSGLEKVAEQGEFEEILLSNEASVAQQVRQGSQELQGFPRQVLISDSQTDEPTDKPRVHVYRGEETHALMVAALAQGKVVQLRYQVANRFTTVSDTPVEVEPQSRTPSSEPKQTGFAAAPRYFGPQYDPKWVRGQFLLALTRKGRLYRDKRAADTWVDVLTGEVLQSPVAGELLVLLTTSKVFS